MLLKISVKSCNLQKIRDMSRKEVQGPIRDKEKSKLRFLNAVGKIIKSKGYQGLQVTKIATVAGLDKKLIYRYYGSVDNLVNEYLRSRDYWNKINENDLSKVDLSDGGKELSKVVVGNQFEFLKKNKESQKIILWELSESKSLLRKLADERESIGEKMFETFTDKHFKKDSRSYRAVMAILISSTYYLNMHAEVNGSFFCGLDFKNDEDRKLVQKTLEEMVDCAFEKYE